MVPEVFLFFLQSISYPGDFFPGCSDTVCEKERRKIIDERIREQKHKGVNDKVKRRVKRLREIVHAFYTQPSQETAVQTALI